MRRSVQRDPTLIDGHDEGEEGAALLFGFDESHAFGEIDTASLQPQTPVGRADACTHVGEDRVQAISGSLVTVTGSRTVVGATRPTSS